MNSITINKLRDEKKNLEGPLQKKNEERDDLKKKLSQFENHKMNLANLRSKLGNIKESTKKIFREK